MSENNHQHLKDEPNSKLVFYLFSQDSWKKKKKEIKLNVEIILMREENRVWLHKGSPALGDTARQFPSL